MGEEQTEEKKNDTNAKLSPESANKVLKRLFNYYEIDIDDIEDERLKDAIKMAKPRLIRAIKKGRLRIVVEDGIRVTQVLKNGTTEIEYREIDGEAKSAMDGHPAEAFNRRAQALLGSLSGLGEAAIKKLKGVDMSLAEVLGLIFLAV